MAFYHFKDYSERGLFGRFKGVYWWPSHIRGDGSQGVVVKRYEVGRPVEESVDESDHR